MATYEEAIADTTSSCRTLDEKIIRVKVQLAAIEEALFNSAGQGGVIKYKVDTGQTRIEVEVSSVSQLRNSYRDFTALYNELCGLRSGSNVMAIRDGGTLRR